MATTSTAIVVLLTLAACSMLLAVTGQQAVIRVEPVSELCLGCICEAISNCNRSVSCEGDVCGIFRITWPYWADSGKPVLPQDDPNAAHAYSRCATDPYCAAKSVTAYMEKYKQDCNHDGVINCYDYAAMHKLGGYGCGAPLPPDYLEKFNNCQRQVAQFTSGNTKREIVDII